MLKQNITPEESSTDGQYEGTNSPTENQQEVFELIEHREILSKILSHVVPLNFRAASGITDATTKLVEKHFLVSTVREIIRIAQTQQLGICIEHKAIYIYNGAFWKTVDEKSFRVFLGECAKKMGINNIDAEFHPFRERLLKQFFESANLSKPEQSKDTVLINLKNGTYVIDGNDRGLVLPRKEDFIKYQLPFEFDPSATAPIFERFLNEVLPEGELQSVLFEYIGYSFVKTSTLKLEKVLLLHGHGANGKSVIFDIINALLGAENVSSYSLAILTSDRGASYRAKIADKLINYASEIGININDELFKQMASGEPLEARPLFSQPYLIIDYAKLLFNCNDLPKFLKYNHAIFRRLMIINFRKQIPAEEQDKELARKIIAGELPGIFNLVLQGLDRVLRNRNFSSSELINQEIKRYEKEADSIAMFLEEEGYERSTDSYIPLDQLYKSYIRYCSDNQYSHLTRQKLSKRLRLLEYEFIRYGQGFKVRIKQIANDQSETGFDFSEAEEQE